MTPSPGPSAGKITGLLLLGVAAVALVLGLVTVVGGGLGSRTSDGAGRSSAAAGQSGGASVSAESGSTGPSGSGSQGPFSGGSATSKSAPVPSQNPPSGATTKVVPPPVAGGDHEVGPGGGGKARNAATHGAPVRVYNNSTIKGLAAKAAAEFRAAGYNVVEVGNYPQGIIPASTVYWGSGNGERATAKSLAAEFGMRAEPRYPGIARASPGVIAIVTKNFTG